MAGTIDNVQCPFGPEWRVVREIGHGSYGSVFLIERSVGDEIIQSAMKVIRLPADENEPEQIMRRTGRSRAEIIEYYQALGDALLPEIQLMSRLRGDSHIVSYEDHVVLPHESGIGMDIFIRMEYLESLPHWLKGRQLTNGDVVQLGIQLCEGLETCAHSKIVHRDIKPANIFVAANGAFKLGDFGIAQKMDSFVDAEDRKLGSLNYIAPEVKRGEAFDERVDIYGLGMVMYRLLNDGRIPFLPSAPSPYTDDQEDRARQKRLSGERLPKPTHSCDVLWAVVEKACAYHPDARYQDASEMGRALRAISGHSDLAMALPVENTRRKDSDTSPRTRSTGPNGTELRKHNTGTLTPSPIPEKSEFTEPKLEAEVPKKRGIPKIALIPAAIIITLMIVLTVVKLTGVKQSIELSVKQDEKGVITLQIDNGKPPYRATIKNGDSIVDEYSFDSKIIGIDSLVPGTVYVLDIVDSRNATNTVEVTTPEGKAYAGADLQISSMIIYECDRQALAASDWLTLSAKNRVKRLAEEGIVFRKASASGQSNQWYVLIHAKGGGESESESDALLVLRLPNDVVVSQKVLLKLSSDAYVQTPVDLDPILDKAWKACGEWVPGQAFLELYVQGQYVKDTAFMISRNAQSSTEGGN